MSLKTVVVTGLGCLLVLGGLYLYTNPTSVPASYANFTYFMQKHDRNYLTPTQFEYKLSVFQQNLHYIARHNSARRSYRLGVGPFGDMTFKEFRRARLMKPLPNPSAAAATLWSARAEPAEKDWAKAGKVTRVLNQGNCGSCWAFGAVGALESALAIAGGALELYSEQELVDCSGRFGNMDCFGGLPSNAYDYIERQGLGLAADYPYTATKNACRVRKDAKRVRIGGYQRLKELNPNGLIEFLDQGPTVVGLEVQRDFMHYSAGVFTGSASCGQHMNHAVLITGYKVSPDEQYFMLKNSWGEGWGEQGYMRIGFGTLNTGVCGMINTYDVIPAV